MQEKFGRRYPEKGAAGSSAPPPRTHPAGFHQPVYRAFAESDPADPLDFPAGDRLMVSNHREGLDGGPGQFTGDRSLDAQLGREIGSGAKRPTTGQTDEIDAAPGVALGNVPQQPGDIGFLTE